MKFIETFQLFEKTQIIDTTNRNELPIIFVAGLDSRPNDLSLEKQTSFILSKLGNREINSFCSSRSCRVHNDVSTGVAMKFLKDNPNSLVILFSAGTQYAKTASVLIKDIRNLFILEPYPGARQSIESAINRGLPHRNVIVGNSNGRGRGIIPSQEIITTPSNYSHFGSLKFLSELISKI